MQIYQYMSTEKLISERELWLLPMTKQINNRFNQGTTSEHEKWWNSWKEGLWKRKNRKIREQKDPY